MQLPLLVFPNPEKDRQRFNTWVMKVGGNIIGMENDDIYRHRSVCHLHFEEKFCCRFKRLSNIAVPTLNLPDKGILPPECKDTADILPFWDEIFDSVNGSFEKRHKSHGKTLLRPATPNSAHCQLWLEAKKKIKNMKFINNVTGHKENVPTLNNWVWTLDGLELLLKRLNTQYNVTSVWLRHLNQDSVENFFGAIRSHGCRNTNPTPERFESAFTSLLINSLSSVHAPGANCEEDSCNGDYDNLHFFGIFPTNIFILGW